MLKRISVSLFLGANLCTIVLMWLCVALTFVSPDFLPRLSLLTLAFPIFLAVNILFIIFWLLFKARFVWVPIAGALLIGGYVLDYCPLHFGTNKDNKADSTLSITVISYNVGYMTTNEQKEELLRYLTTADADIICLQELSKSYLNQHQAKFDSLSFHATNSGGEVILTRLPFLSDTIHIDYPTRDNHSLACWIDCYGDSMLVVNNHLESNKLSTEEKDEYTNAIIDPNREAIKSSSRKLMGKLSEAAAYRGIQADSICALIKRAQFSHSVVSDSLQLHGLKHARLPCPSPTPRVYSNSCPLSQ